MQKQIILRISDTNASAHRTWKEVFEAQTNDESEAIHQAHKKYPNYDIYYCEEDQTLGNETNPIDNVTVDLLDIGLRYIGVNLPKSTIDKIIDLVELIEEKGGDTSIKDLSNLSAEWEEHAKKTALERPRTNTYVKL